MECLEGATLKDPLAAGPLGLDTVLRLGIQIADAPQHSQRRGPFQARAPAFALALSGDLPQSRALADDLAREFPEETSVQFSYLPTLRALFSLNTHDPAAAIQALQIASGYDLALGGVGFTGRFGGLYPIYVRGMAYLASRQPAEAAGEFQRTLDHRSIVIVDPMDALARLQLARALALLGDTVKAKRAYSDLLTLRDRTCLACASAPVSDLKRFRGLTQFPRRDCYAPSVVRWIQE